MKALLFLLPLLVCIVSCSSIRSKQLVGAEPVDFTANDANDISGEWVNNEGEVFGSLKVTNAKNGEILFTPTKNLDEEPGEEICGIHSGI